MHTMARFSVHHTIADALYGQVLLAHDNTTHELVAIKKMNIAAATAHTVVRGAVCHVSEDLAIEKQVSRLLSADGGHPNVLRLRADFVDEGYDHMVFDYCNGGDLFDQTHKGALQPAVAQRYFGQLVHGVGYMHAKGVAHRDLSLENVLLHNDTCFVCDFGLAASARTTCDDSVGKPFYMAPEVVQGIEYDPTKSDVWSLGIMLFMMLTGVPLWQSASAHDARFLYFHKHGLRALVASWHVTIDKLAMDLLEHMLCLSPVKRFSLAQVAAHDFVGQPLKAVKCDAHAPLKKSTTGAAKAAFAFVKRFLHHSHPRHDDGAAGIE
ncbi:Aste57867_8980 [Aphanomyces stellatus]|uniref:Aste57867_8980 protein n=1 Tax=Aphanomyces stellatus TaxID=120398 RepID=A0A485KLM0_9STRA|nr:hypothetical protein As57867_008945 [Aphanomyces stellatus]VFT85864.1 Aste57867_8980 [Aphanomyces stellatus]